MDSSIWTSIIRVGVIIIVGLAGMIILQLGLRGIEKRLKKTDTNEDRLRRLLTLLNAGRSMGIVLILLIMLMMILNAFEINISPILASAGVAGLAISLGAQTLIKDFLGGIIILTENQFTIGDVIKVGEISGSVERITMRATYIRDIEGKLNLIPNGEIRTISNLTTQWAQVVVTFNVDYESDMQIALRALEKAISQVQSDKQVAASLLEDPTVYGWTGFTDWAVQAQIISKTKPGKQWSVARELRKAGLKCLQDEGIHVAVPMQRVLSIS